MIDRTEDEEQTELVVEEENDASGREHEPEKQPILKRRKIVAKNGGATNRWTLGYDLKQMQFIWLSHYFFPSYV